MKFALKSIVAAAAAFVAVGAASAASVTVNFDGKQVSGSGTLTYSKNLTGAMTLGGVSLGAFGGATTSSFGIQQQQTATADGSAVTTAATTYKTWQTASGITSLVYDSASNSVQEVVSTGGATQTMAQNDTISAAGGNAQVGNLDVKFNADGSVGIFGSITGTANDGTNVNFNGLLFNVKATDVIGAKTFTSTAGTYYTTLNNLAITDNGFNALATVFGLDPTGLGYTSLKGAAANFGSLTSAIKVAAVPEPSTYALMGLGLVGVALTARRRRAA